MIEKSNNSRSNKNLKEVCNSNLFLSTHTAIKEFAENFVANTFHQKIKSELNKSQNSWTVVCERSADLQIVRNEIFRSVENLVGHSLNILGGISFYTLDQLGSHFCASIASFPNTNLPFKFSNSIYKPYISIKKQEKIVQFILNLFHMPAHETLPLAQQIIAILDTPLPPDLSLSDALMSALNLKKKRSYKDIPTALLKQILASFQSSRLILNRHARFQTLVEELTKQEFWNAFNENTEEIKNIFPLNFINSTVLWISAPEYQLDTNINKNYKSGEIPSPLIEDFFSALLKIRAKVNHSHKFSFHYSRTILNTNISTKDITQTSNISIFYAQNETEFYQKAINYTKHNDPSLCVFLGEFDSHKYQSILSNAAGSYKVSDEDINDWETQQSNNFFVKEITEQINQSFDDFLETASYIENFNKLNEIAQIYSLPIYDLSDKQLRKMFRSYIKNETIIYCHQSQFDDMNRSFSFFSSNSMPNTLMSIWSHGCFEQSNLATRLLNQVFTFFQSHGVDINNPCNEKSFSSFWKHILWLGVYNTTIKIQFLIENIDVLDKFPINFTKKQFLPLNKNPADLHQKSYEITKNKILNSNINSLQKLFKNTSFKVVSTTQLESYIECPFQFFLKYSLNLSPIRKIPPFSADPILIGTQVHKICEILVSHLVNKFGNDGYIIHAPRIYQSAIDAIEPESIFLSTKKSTWEDKLKTATKENFALFSESIDEIFISHNHLDNKSPEITKLNTVLFEEILKRTFLKFLKSEIEIIAFGNKLRIGTAREYPFSINIGNVTVHGRIDRIDLNKDGYEIIDYKVSPISKSTNELCLLPSEFLSSKKKNKLSIQGAVYSLAFGKYVFEEISDSQESIGFESGENRLNKFSLYRLKNIKNDPALLSYTFDKNTQKISGIDQVKLIESELKRYTENLDNKNFFPQPLNQKHTCQYCPYQHLCPYPVEKGFSLK